MKLNLSKISILSLVIALSAAISGCHRGQKAQYITIEGSIWHTAYHITYKGTEDLSADIISKLREVEASLSPFLQDSQISKINNNVADSTDAYVTKVLEASKSINQIVPGFDPTVAPLLNLWGFGHDNAEENYVPTAQQIDSCLQSVGIARCSINNGVIIKPSSETQFNFSAITKGLGCDEVGRMLVERGINDYMIEIGGEIALSGVNPAGEKWRIMVDAPVNGSLPGDSQVTTISVTDCGIATSGNYRNYHETAYGTYGHTISPLTGYPQPTALLSVTVIAPDAMTADAFATAIMATPDTELATTLSRLPDNISLIIVTTVEGIGSLPASELETLKNSSIYTVDNYAVISYGNAFDVN